MMAALNSLSDTFHIWLILSLAQAHCLFLFKLWFLILSKRLLVVYWSFHLLGQETLDIIQILAGSCPSFSTQALAYCLGLWCQQQFGFQSACNIILVCWLVGHCCGSYWSFLEGRASASGRIRLPGQGRLWDGIPPARAAQLPWSSR